MVSTNENNISSYYYEVYDLGEGTSLASSFSSSSSDNSFSTSQNESNSTNNTSSGFGGYNSYPSSAKGTLVFDASVGPGLPLAVPTASLQEGHKYNLKVAATDAAGNAGIFGDSDGFVATSADYATCENDEGAPAVNIVINDTIPESCTSTPVELQCADTSGCGISYGKASYIDLCEPTQAYNGQKLFFDKSGWICYAVKDSVGNNYTVSQRITLLDTDGDKVLDSCDQCSGTAAGKVVDEIGCASGQIPLSERGKGADKDGLPDMWERLYDGEGCNLDSAAADSNTNGISDTLEDYDEDGYTNYEEYDTEFNPCVAEPGKTGVSVTAVKKPSIETLDIVAWIFLL